MKRYTISFATAIAVLIALMYSAASASEAVKTDCVHDQKAVTNHDMMKHEKTAMMKKDIAMAKHDEKAMMKKEMAMEKSDETAMMKKEKVMMEKEKSMMKHDEKAMMKHDSGSRAYLHNYNLPSSGVALEGYCPVAYFAVNKPVLGKKEFASEYNGVTYYLVNADAKQVFDENPEKYLPAYGGWCATGMREHDKFPVDPRNFKIVDGRLLMFLKNQHVDALELWNQGDEEEHLAKADAFWATISQ